MAAEAFASGDYRNASLLYDRARELAQKDGDDNAWMENTVSLARSLLRSGDPEGARRLLNEFSRRFPAHSPGLLPGEILAAEGHISEAESFFRSLLNSSDDRNTRDSARLALAYLQVRFGASAAALEELAKLEDADAELRRKARLLRICALIRSGRTEEARKLASESATGFDPALPAARLKLLAMLADLRDGKIADFVQEWDKLRSDIRPYPDELAFEVLDTAARLSLKASQPARAALCWRDAYGFAESDDERRDVLRKLFNAYSSFDVGMAADTARRYAKYFPAATDRAQLLNGAGRLLAGSGDFRGAMELFSQVISDGELLPAERCDAARDAALAAEAVNDDAAARRHFNYLIGNADSTAGQNRELIFYAEYLLRRRDYAAAEKALRQASGSAVKELAEKAARLMIQALLPQKKFVPALAAAEKLKRSSNAENVEFGGFYAALLAEKLGRRAEARRQYLEFAERHKSGEFVREARFAAALLALEEGDNAAAAREFLAYAADYPKADAAAALFWALRAYTLAGDAAGAEAAFDALASGPGAGKAYYAAALQLAEFLRSTGKSERGLKLLDGLDKSKCGDADSAALLLERARLYSACRRNADALKTAGELLERFPAVAVAADAAFLSGNLHADRGEYVEALAAFRRALELRPSGVFGEVARGRVGDCLLAIYASNQGESELDRAVEVFEKLSAGAEFPTVRLQSLFKLGCALEYRGTRLKALDAYYQTLLYARTLRQRGIPFESSWCSRAAYAALRLLLDSGSPGRFQWGTRVMNAYRQLGLPEGNAEFEALKQEFTERYLNREI